MFASTRSSLLFLVALLLVAGACRGARRKVEGDLVKSVQVKGLGWPLPAVTQAQVRGQMGQKSSGFGARLPLVNTVARVVAFDPQTLDDDTYRIETWLAHQGFFNARVEGWEVRRLRPARYRRDGRQRKAGVVEIVGQVGLGSRSEVRGLDVAWTEDGADRYWKSSQENLVRRAGYVQPGTPFVLDNVDYTVNELQRRIRDHGHIFGTARAEVTAHPEDDVVDVVFRADTGPMTLLAGPPEVIGLERVRLEDVRSVLALTPGEVLKVSELEEAQQRLVSLGVFTMARVEPLQTDEESSQVPVQVTVTEARFGTIRGGGGIEYDGVTITPQVSAEVDHRNIDGRLGKFEGGANVGAGVPLVGGIEAARLLWGLHAGIVRQRAFGPKWDTSASASVKRDLLASQLLYTRARVTAGLTHHFTDDVTLTVRPAAEFVRLGAGNLLSKSDLSEADQLLVAATQGGDPSGGRNPFLMALWESVLTIDWLEGAAGLDPHLDPRDGYFYRLGVRQAVPMSNNAPRFTDLSAEARIYRSFLSPDKRSVPLTLGGRFLGRWLPGTRPLQEAIPYSERAFMGGSNDMRGFRRQQVGPYDCVCLAREEPTGGRGFLGLGQPDGPERLEPNPTFLPRGGRLSLLLSGEARYRTRAGWGVAVFGDAGVLASRTIELQPRYLSRAFRWDLGLGYRQQTPIGPVRVDLAFRPRYPEDQAPMRQDAFVVAGEPSDPNWYRGRYYGCDAIPDARLTRRIPALGVSRDLKGGLPPVMVNLSVAIGEAL